MIYCLGISHQTAPVSLRERLACRLDELVIALPQETAVQELILLSTCNRIEIYAELAAESSLPKPLFLDLLAQAAALTPGEFVGYTYIHTGNAAVNHLLRVVSGLDSMVLGEPQILGQVTRAYMTAVSQKTSGPVLNALFQCAIRTGKRVHSETSISSNPASISSVAIALAQEAIGGLSRRQALVIGAGEMGRLAVKALRNRKLTNISIANRTLSRAESVVSEWNGRAYTLDQLPQAVAEADVVIAAARSETPLIEAEMIAKRERPLVLVDIAVPRNINQDVRRLPFIRLFDVDDLHSTLDESLAERRAEIPLVETVIAEEERSLEAELRQLSVKPIIVDLRRKAEAIRQAELERTLRHLGDIDPQSLAHIQHLSRSLVNKLLHEPTIRLREAAREETAEPYVATIRDLFGLEN